jgi:hypothetical protein
MQALKFGFDQSVLLARYLIDKGVRPYAWPRQDLANSCRSLPAQPRTLIAAIAEFKLTER